MSYLTGPMAQNLSDSLPVKPRQIIMQCNAMQQLNEHH